MNILKKSVCCVVGVLLALPSIIDASEVNALQEGILEDYWNQVEQWQIDLGDAPAGTVISKDGEIIFEKYSKGNGEFPVDVNAESLWPLYSISKAFGTVVLLRQIDSGKLELGTKVSEYVDAFASRHPNGADRTQLTVRDLVAKRAALQLYSEEAPRPGNSNSYKEAYLKTPIDGTEKFSRVGWAILQEIIETEGGASFSDLLAREISKPMGLNSIKPVYFYDAEPRALPENRDSEYRFSRKPYLVESGLYGNIRDVNKFSVAWMRADLGISKELYSEALTEHCVRSGSNFSQPAGLGNIWIGFEADAFIIAGGGGKFNVIQPKTGVVLSLFFIPHTKEARAAGRPRVHFQEVKIELAKIASKL